MASLNEMMQQMNDTKGVGLPASIGSLSSNPYISPSDLNGSVSGAFITPKKLKEQALQNLRSESGAAISEDELRSEIERLSQSINPEYQLRQQAMSILRAESGAAISEDELESVMDMLRKGATPQGIGAGFNAPIPMPMMQGQDPSVPMPMMQGQDPSVPMPTMPRPPIPDQFNDLINFEGLPAKNANEIAAENETAQAIEILMMELQNTQDPDEQQILTNMIENTSIKANAQYSPLMDQLSAQGGEDNMMAHVRSGDVNISKEMMEANPQLEAVIEKTALDLNINPESMVYGTGIASLDPDTGLEQHGFFKKLVKNVGKIVGKVAPIAMLVPGVGTALGGVLGGLGSAVTSGLGSIGLGGLGSALGSVGSTVMGGIANLGIPGVSSIAGGTGARFGGISKGLGSLKGLLGDGPLSGFLGGGSELTVQPNDTLSQIAQKNGTTIEAIMKANPSITDPNMIQAGATLNMPGGGGNFNVGRAILGGEGRTPDFIKQGENLLKGEYTPGAGGPQQPGGSGGFGGMSDLLKMGGAGALAAGLGKLAFDEAKNAKGAPVTPYTTMDATGRYNIEAELARRMGQQAPNPVEFGLLPANTLPELSGGQPRVVGAAEGGAMYPNKGLESLARVAPDVVERMGYNMGGQAMNYNMGGRPMMPMGYNMGGQPMMPMAYAEGGNVAMEEFERMNGVINGEGTETSDDIPAMLSDGEFVMTGQAVRGAGSYNMNNDSGILTLTPNGNPGRDAGTEMMYQLMEAFSGQTTPA